MSSSSQNQILEFSPFLNQLVNRHPDWLSELQASGRLENTSPPDADLLAAEIEKPGWMLLCDSSETGK